MLPYAIIGIGLGLLLLELKKPKQGKENGNGKVHAVGPIGPSSTNSDLGSVERGSNQGSHGNRGLRVPIREGSTEEERSEVENAKANNAVFGGPGGHNGSEPSASTEVNRKDARVGENVRNERTNNGQNGADNSSHDVFGKPGREHGASDVEIPEGSINNATASS